MVGHENPGVNPDLKLGGTLFKPVSTGGNILVRRKHRLAVLNSAMSL